MSRIALLTAILEARNNGLHHFAQALETLYKQTFGAGADQVPPKQE